MSQAAETGAPQVNLRREQTLRFVRRV